MNLNRIQYDINNAQGYFKYVEDHSTSAGGLMSLAALQTSVRLYTLEINFPYSYPNEMPKVYVRKPHLKNSPHQYPNNRICYLHPSVWNPGRHDLTFVISRSAKWLAKYEVYCSKGRWPGAGIDHN